MREPTIRLMRQTERDETDLQQWSARNAELSGLEREIFTYPATRVMVAEDERRTLLFVPVHPVYVMDSIAPNPDASHGEIGLALRKITEIVKWESQKAGQGQIYFNASEPLIRRFAQRHERFEELSGVFPLRMRI